jgi:hypothetical protein
MDLTEAPNRTGCALRHETTSGGADSATKTIPTDAWCVMLRVDASSFAPARRYIPSKIGLYCTLYTLTSDSQAEEINHHRYNRIIF